MKGDPRTNPYACFGFYMDLFLTEDVQAKSGNVPFELRSAYRFVNFCQGKFHKCKKHINCPVRGCR